MARFFKDRYFWYIVTFLVLTGILVYTTETYMLNWLPAEEKWHLTYITLQNIVFLITVAIAAWRFGVKGGLVACLAIWLILLPHTLLEGVSPLRLDYLAELALIGAVAVIFSWLIGTRKQAEQVVRESEERYRALVHLGAEVGESIVMLQDNEQGLAIQTFVNDEWPRITGYSREELITMSFFDLVHPEYREASVEGHRRKMAGESIPGVFELLIIRKDGTEVAVELTSAHTTFKGKRATVAYIRDITERKQAEAERKELEQRAQLASRLAAVGEMTSGIAHEINNPLTSIIGFAQLVMDRNIPDDIRKDIGVIYSEAQRTAEVVKSLLAFARKHAPVRQPTDINGIINGVLELRAYEHRVNNIQVNTRFDPKLPETVVDYFQMQQVFLNIILNGETTMLEAHNKGTLTITTQKVNSTIKISFTDDGSGIAKENLSRIFDPFFTTREVGKGTGLGLSICYGIVAEHGGRIYARSKLGKGATFVVELPINAD